MSPSLSGVTGPASRSSLPTAGLPRTGPGVPPGSLTDASRPSAARQRFVTAGLLLSGLAVLVLGYLRMARATPTNADAAANALQAWDILHGNVLLRGWTLSDVSFYPTELVQYALIELFYGLDQDVVHVASAITYTLLIVFAALVAKGDATGRAGWLRAGIAVATLLVPEPHVGWAIVLYAPDHTGTGVPLLLTWLLLDRRAATPLRRWWPVGVAALLTVAQMADPLALFIGALPLAAVSGLRMLRARTWRGPDAHLLVAAAGSAAVAHGLLSLIWQAGGFSLHPPIAKFSPLVDLPGHVWMAVNATALNYGAYFPVLGDEPFAGLAVAAGVVKLALLLLATAAAVTTLARMTARRAAEPGDRIAEILTVAIVVNLAAYIASTQAGDLVSARQIVAALPFGAALAGRVWGDRLAAWLAGWPAVWLARRPADSSVGRPMAPPADSPVSPTAGSLADSPMGPTVGSPMGPTVGSPMGPTVGSTAGPLARGQVAGRLGPVRLLVGLAAGVLVLAFATQAATAQSRPPEASRAADWLVAHDLHYGLGSYWASSNITVATHGAVQVAPVIGPGIRTYRWESNADWYDADRHDARFVVIDLAHPHYGTVDAAIAQFGQPVRRRDFDRWAVLVYDHNLLVNLPAQCGGLNAAAHAHCPPLPPKIPGADLLPTDD